MHEGYVVMRRGLTVLRVHGRINKAMLLSRLYRARGVLCGLAALALLAAIVVLAWLLHSLFSVLS
jgi:hypothetical protein